MKELNALDKANIEMKKNAVLFFKNAQKVGNKIFVELPLDYLKVDQKMYQRPVQSHVRIIAQTWNDDKCNPLLANYRGDGYFYIIDGQHRYEAARMRGMESIVCEVLVGLNVKEEADLFVEQNYGTKKLSPYDTYKANICRSDAVDCIIKEVCDKYDIKVVKSNTIKTLKCLTEARKIIRGGEKDNADHHDTGKDILDWCFQIISGSGWENDKKGYCHAVVYALSNIYVKYPHRLTEMKDILIEFMKDYTYEKVDSMADLKFPGKSKDLKCMMLLLEVVEGTFNDPSNKIVSFVA